MSCKRTHEIDGYLGSGEELPAELGRHAVGCASCASAVEEGRDVLRAVARLAEWPVDVPAAFSIGRPRRSRRWPWVAAAAALLIAVVASLRGDDPGDASYPERNAVTVSPDGAIEVATVGGWTEVHLIRGALRAHATPDHPVRIVTEECVVESDDAIMRVGKESAMNGKRLAITAAAAVVVWVAIDAGGAWIRDDDGDWFVGEGDEVTVGERGVAREKGEAPPEVERDDTAAEKPAKKDGGRQPFHGRVIDLENRPIAGATVAIEKAEIAGEWTDGADHATATTGEDGTFTLEPGESIKRIQVRARATGKIPNATDHRRTRDREIVLKMHPGVAVKVRVVDADGNGVAGAAVQAFSQDWERGLLNLRHAVPTDRGRTGETGRIELTLPDTVGRIVALKDEFAPTMVDGIEFGKVEGEVVIEVGAGGFVSGRVLDAAGGALAGCAVTCEAYPLRKATVTTDGAGRFRFDRIPTPPPHDDSRRDIHLVVTALPEGRAPTHATATAPAAGESVDVTIRIASTRTLVGSVRWPDGRAATEYTVTITNEDRAAMMAGYGFHPLCRPVPVGADGQFTAEPVPAGRVRVDIGTKGHLPIRRIPLTIPARGDLPRLDVVLEKRSKLTARVLDAGGDAVPGCTLTLKDAHRQMAASHRRKTGEDGRATFEGITARRAILIVDPEDAATTTVEVDLTREPTDEIIVKLGAGIVTGTAHDLDGRPLTGAEIGIMRPVFIGNSQAGVMMNWGSAKVRPDEYGRFRFGGIGEGKYRLGIKTPGWQRVSGRDEVVEGDHVTLVFATVEDAARLKPKLITTDAATGEAVAPFRPRIEFDDGNGAVSKRTMWAQSGAPGHYNANEPLAPGSYTATVFARGFRAHTVTGLTFGRDADPIRVALDRGTVVRGRVTTRDGTGIADVSIRVNDSWGRTDADGRYEVTGLSPGAVTVEADGLYCGELTRDVVLTNEPATVDFVVDAMGAVEVTLSGEVTPGDRWEVKLAPRDGGGARATGATAAEVAERTALDREGKWTLKGVRPGIYTVTATWDGRSMTLPPITIEPGVTAKLILEP